LGKIRAICISSGRGTAKQNIGRGELIENFGLKGDAHGGNWHRQVSLLALEKIDAFRAKGDALTSSVTADGIIAAGAFGENLVVEGLDPARFPVGTRFRSGDAILELTQIGKEGHNHCEIFRIMGDCIMPREGAFARVLRGGVIQTGDEISALYPYRAAIITVSDRAHAGKREDTSGPGLKRAVEEAGYKTGISLVVPDAQELLEAELRRIADGGLADLILTTGGTGFSPRDRSPEAALAIAERTAPGIAEAMRAGGMAVTKRAMLSRGVAVIRGASLIINLPGSPGAAMESLGFVIEELRHGLDILTGRDSECG
jgi:molybdenum cofactor synthesis domain-containing protein